MKLRSVVAGMGTGLFMVLAAQSAQAQACNPGGGVSGETQIGVGQEDVVPCYDPGGYATVSGTAYSQSNAVYDYVADVEGGDAVLQAGDVVEITIDLDDMVVALMRDEKRAVELAGAYGFSPGYSKDNVFKAGAATKLSQTEYLVLATAMMHQSGRVTGRSTPASPGASRASKVQEAFADLIRQISRSIQSIDFNGEAYIRNEQITTYPDGTTTTRRFSMGVRAGKR